MLLRTVLVRFYKSFNYDYLKKFHGNAKTQPWEKIENMWYPYVRVPIEKEVTTVVGANESGKSHLLTAIEKGMSGKQIEREDFCRYSNFFTVETGKLKWPDFGFEFSGLSDAEQKSVKDICGAGNNKVINSFYVFRKHREELTVYLPKGESGDFSEYGLSTENKHALENLLPHIFRLDAEVAIPSSVSIKDLTGVGDKSRAETLGRRHRFDFMDKFLNSSSFFTSQETVTSNAPAIVSGFSKYSASDPDSKEANKRTAEVELARKLICEVANVDTDALTELYNALRDGKEGHTNGIIDRINDRLAASLNFPHWWVQDRNFQLKVSPREFDLVFTIRDRTETEYSFSERSSGLRYFLSYFVQYLAHTPKEDKTEILLMDEPDAYLSSQAQQDLLKIFEAYASPQDERRPTQVVYVTHSPFLIDKNHAERIRVLDKGVSDEGTRVVKDAARNHYEPLRSAFGTYTGEATFIGNSNLMVEGLADQILIAGAANFLRGRRNVSDLEMLDLNATTIVPAGSSSAIPYMAYLARGRDVEKPAVIVLLDSDSAGNEAKRKLRKGPYANRILKDNLILQVGDIVLEERNGGGHKLVEIEDLIPLEICVTAAQNYARNVCQVGSDKVRKLTAEEVRNGVAEGKTVFGAVVDTFNKACGDDFHIEKVGFARSVVDLVLDKTSDSVKSQSAKSFEENFKVLFRSLNRAIREAERELSQERVTQKIDRVKKSFLQDNENGSSREKAHLLFEDIEASLNDDEEGDTIRAEVAKLRRDFSIDKDITQPIPRFDDFRIGLEKIKYAGRLSTQEDLG